MSRIDLARKRSRSALATIVLSAALAACARTGDLGRPAPQAWDVLLPAAGSVAALVREEPVSWADLTDDEEEMRARAWRFLMPAHERAWFDRQVAELARTRVLPAAWRPHDRTAYLAALEADAIRSPVSRYRRLGEDIVADGTLAVAFAALAARVAEMDRARLAAIPFVRGAEAARVASARARVVENACLVAGVRAALGARIEGYDHALARLFLATPDPAGVEPERALADLRLRATVLDGLATVEACSGLQAVRIAPPLPPRVPSRRRTVLGK